MVFKTICIKKKSYSQIGKYLQLQMTYFSICKVTFRISIIHLTKILQRHKAIGIDNVHRVFRITKWSSSSSTER